MEEQTEQKTKVLVTGALGFIGSHLCDKLVGLGYDVLGADNLIYGKKENSNPSVKYAICDNTDLLKPELAEMLEGVKVIFHLGAQSRIQPSFEDPVFTSFANGFGTAAVLELARNLKARVVYAGSSTANDDVLLNPYAFWKQVGEGACQLYSACFGVSTAIARFYNVYETSRNPDIGLFSPVIGLWQRQYLAGETITITGDGEQTRDFTSVFDIVDGLILLSKEDRKGEIFHFGTGTNYTLNEISTWFANAGAQIGYLPARPGEARITLAPADDTQARLGWKPLRSVKDYISDFLSKHAYGSNDESFD